MESEAKKTIGRGWNFTSENVAELFFNKYLYIIVHLGTILNSNGDENQQMLKLDICSSDIC